MLLLVNSMGRRRLVTMSLCVVVCQCECCGTKFCCWCMLMNSNNDVTAVQQVMHALRYCWLENPIIIFRAIPCILLTKVLWCLSWLVMRVSLVVFWFKLNIHMVTWRYSGEKPFECTVCWHGLLNYWTKFLFWFCMLNGFLD
jgi:hypothetical protein